MDIKVDVSLGAKVILNTLKHYEYEAYLVGGCVRDSVLSRPVHDWDICTSAKPEQVIDIFSGFGHSVIETGIQHGTVTVVVDKENFEVTTYRTDGEYSNGRHPDNVTFTTSLKEDLSRRDFTINALCYSEQTGIIDYFNGLEDLKNKVIRCVDNPESRFNEDNLRRLRAIRFACQLGFEIESSTLNALAMNPQRIMLLSVERVRDELCKILLSNNPYEGIKRLWFLDMLQYIIPELEECDDFNQYNPHHNKDVFHHILSVVENTPSKLEIRLGALLHDIAKPLCFSIDEKGVGHFYEHAIESADLSRTILTRLRFDNNTVDKICKLVYNHMTPTDLNNKSIKKLINRVGQGNIYDLIELMIADRKGMAKEYQEYGDILELKNKIDRIINEKQPLSVKDLAINGNDLIQLGYKPSKEMGDKLKELLEMVLGNPELNTKDQLLKIIEGKE